MASFKRYEASGPVAVGIANQNIVTNFRRTAPGEVHLPPLRALAKMVYEGHEFIDLYNFDVPGSGDDQ